MKAQYKFSLVQERPQLPYAVRQNPRAAVSYHRTDCPAAQPLMMPDTRIKLCRCDRLRRKADRTGEP